MTASPGELGFSEPMPRVTGDKVTVVTAGKEQLKALQEVQRRRGAAEIVEAAIGDDSEALKSLVDSATDAYIKDPTAQTADDETIVTLAAADMATDDKSPIADTAARELGVIAGAAPEPFTRAMADIGPGGAKEVLDAIDVAGSAGVDVVPPVKAFVPSPPGAPGKKLDLSVAARDAARDAARAEQQHLNELLKREQEAIARECSEKDITPGNMSEHIEAIRTIESLMGTDALHWREEIRNGVRAPEAANNYISKLFFTEAVLAGAVQKYREAIAESWNTENGLTFMERKEQQQPLRKVMKQAMEYVWDVGEGSDDPRHQVLERFMWGDVKWYGFDEGWGEILNQKGIDSVAAYLRAIDTITPDGALRLNEKLGIVNFNAYRPDNLRDMLNVLDHPEDYPRGVSIVLCGKNADYSGAIRKTGERAGSPLSRGTIGFEVDTPDEIEKCHALLNKLNLPLRRLTIQAHGGRESGIRLSVDCLLQQGHLPESLVNLVGRIQPDDSGEKTLNLMSCSQGKRVAGRSMADVFSALDKQLTVTAAPGAAYYNHIGERGAVVTTTNKYYALARDLEESGSEGLAEYLLQAKFQKPGVLRVRGGKTTLDPSGRIRL